MDKVYLCWETYYGLTESDDRMLRVVANENLAKEFCDACNNDPDGLSGKFNYWYEEWEVLEQ